MNQIRQDLFINTHASGIGDHEGLRAWWLVRVIPAGSLNMVLLNLIRQDLFIETDASGMGDHEGHAHVSADE